MAKDNIVLILGAAALGLYLYSKSKPAEIPDTTTTQDASGRMATAETYVTKVFDTTTNTTKDVKQTVTITGKNFDNEVVTYTTPLPKLAPSSYDYISGTGTNSAGFGYSANKPLGDKISTGIQTITNPKTGSTVTRTANSIFAGKGFN
jgi:hypothetical protein